jgi:hypothetical protein
MVVIMDAQQFADAVNELYADTRAPDLLKQEMKLETYSQLMSHVGMYRHWPQGSFCAINDVIERAVSITPAFVLECLETEAGCERLRVVTRRYETADAMYAYCVDQFSMPAAVTVI